MIKETFSPEETFAFGEELGKKCQTGTGLHPDRRSWRGKDSSYAGNRKGPGN